ncbi:hypothetical protein CR513_28455, partial [Mucuna pruriens]
MLVFQKAFEWSIKYGMLPYQLITTGFIGLKGCKRGTGNLVEFDKLKKFRFPTYVHISSDERSKDPNSKKCIFVGYVKGVKRFNFYDPISKKFVIGRDAIFDEQFRQWYKHYNSYMIQISYKKCEYDYCVYVKNLTNVEKLTGKGICHEDLSATKKILGIDIHIDKSSRKLWLSQQIYVQKVLDKFYITSAKLVLHWQTTLNFHWISDQRHVVTTHYYHNENT